jgi:ankyrin repeat protein
MSENNFLKLLNDKKGDIETIKKIIINNKELVNKEFEIKDNLEIFKYSPLTYCLENKLCELSLFLIDQGANINYKTYPKEDYPLLIACRFGLEDIVKKLLLFDNIDIYCLNKNNETCFQFLLNNSNATIYKLIIDYINIKKNIDNNEENYNEKYLNKKKIMINNLSFDFPLEYKNKYINSKLGKFIILFYIFYL